MSPLHVAAWQKNKEISQLLLAAGASVDLQDKVIIFSSHLVVCNLFVIQSHVG